MTVPTVVKITEAPGSGLWLVASRSTSGAYWLVRLGTSPGCTCPYGRTIPDVEEFAARPCRHHKEAAAEERRRQPPPRPTAPPNVSALVD